MNLKFFYNSHEEIANKYILNFNWNSLIWFQSKKKEVYIRNQQCDDICFQRFWLQQWYIFCTKIILFWSHFVKALNQSKTNPISTMKLHFFDWIYNMLVSGKGMIYILDSFHYRVNTPKRLSILCIFSNIVFYEDCFKKIYL